MMEVSILPSSPLHAVDTKKGKNACVHASTSVLPPSSVELPSVAKATWLCLAGYTLSQTGWPRLLQTGARAIPYFPHHGQGNQLCCAWYKFHAEAPLPPSSFDPLPLQLYGITGTSSQVQTDVPQHIAVCGLCAAAIRSTGTITGISGRKKVQVRTCW